MSVEVVKLHETEIFNAGELAHIVGMEGRIITDQSSAEAVAARLKAIRAALNLKPSKAAKLLGVAQSTWTNWEGTPSTPPVRPGLEMAFRICKTFSVTLDYLYLGDTGGLSVRMAERITGTVAN